MSINLRPRQWPQVRVHIFTGARLPQWRLPCEGKLRADFKTDADLSAAITEQAGKPCSTGTQQKDNCINKTGPDNRTNTMSQRSTISKQLSKRATGPIQLGHRTMKQINTEPLTTGPNQCSGTPMGVNTLSGYVTVTESWSWLSSGQPRVIAVTKDPKTVCGGTLSHYKDWGIWGIIDGQRTWGLNRPFADGLPELLTRHREYGRI